MEFRYRNDVQWRYDIMLVSMVDLVWYIVGTNLLLFYGWDKLITVVDYAAKLCPSNPDPQETSIAVIGICTIPQTLYNVALQCSEKLSCLLPQKLSSVII